MHYSYLIPGTPVTKKNSQRMVTIRAKGSGKSRTIPIPSAQFIDYQAAASYFLQHEHDPIDTPINICCLYFMPTHRAVDLTNLLEATDDILCKYKVISDDNCKVVRGHDGSRVFYDKENPRTVIVITDMLPQGEYPEV